MVYDLNITNPRFQLPVRNRTSWMHPCSKHCHLIDYILVRQEDRSDVRVTKSMCSADCWKDHRLLVSKLNLTVQPQKRPQGQKLPKKLYVAKLHDQVVKEAIQDMLNKELDSKPVDVNDIGGEWHKFSNTVYTVLKDTLGTPSRKHQD